MFRFFAFIILTLCSFTSPKTSFKTAQLKYPRVKAAFQERGKELTQLYTSKKLNPKTSHVFIRAFKQEDELELWARYKNNTQFIKLKTYKICAKSGELGPKTRAGDGQVPEGLYNINRFNPASNFHLSLGINYPNKADKLRSGYNPTGGDIFIHGSCVTIGCLPLTDEYIEEVYMACVEAKECLQKKIQVEIYPCRLTKENTIKIKKQFANNQNNIDLWNTLQKSYDFFERNQFPIPYTFDAKGNYLLTP